jgi:hydrogenase-4 membrane subunit HyfE
MLSGLIILGYDFIFFHRFWIGLILDCHLKLETLKTTYIFLVYPPSHTHTSIWIATLLRYLIIAYNSLQNVHGSIIIWTATRATVLSLSLHSGNNICALPLAFTCSYDGIFLCNAVFQNLEQQIDKLSTNNTAVRSSKRNFAISEFYIIIFLSKPTN